MSIVEQLRELRERAATQHTHDLLTQSADTIEAQSRLLALAETLAGAAINHHTATLHSNGCPDSCAELSKAIYAFTDAQAEYQTTGAVPCGECEGRGAKLTAAYTVYEDDVWKLCNERDDLRRQLAASQESARMIASIQRKAEAERDALTSALEGLIPQVPGMETLRDRMRIGLSYSINAERKAQVTAIEALNGSSTHAERVRLMRAVVEAARALHPEPYTVHSDRKAYERFDAALAALDAHERKEQAGG